MATPDLLLALESAPRCCSAALLRGGALLAERASSGGRHNAESLLPAIDEVLTKAGVGLSDLDGLAVAVGPGAFTSLRIAVATAKGLAFGSDLRIAPVSSLAALARAEGPELAPGEAPVVAMLDARREEAYAAAYRLDADGWPEPLGALLPESVYDVDDLAARLPARCVLVEGARVFGEALRERLGAGVALGPGEAAHTLAFAVGGLGRRALASGLGVAAEALSPRYLRRADAEAIRTKEPLEASAGSSPQRFDSTEKLP